jgi:photosystem I P700 chlorophyll a apoprotein A2
VDQINDFVIASLVMVPRGGTCDISAWDAFYLAMFWMLNTIGWVTFYWHWKHMAIWGGIQVNLMNHQIILWAGYVITYG